MQQYVVRAMSREPVGLADPGIALDLGFNVFNFVTEDLDTVLEKLRSLGVTILDIQEMHQDYHQSLDDMLVPGESKEVLFGPTSVSAQGTPGSEEVRS